MTKNNQNTISTTETRATWITSLLEADLEQLNALFPFKTPTRTDFFQFAKELEFLQKILADNLLNITLANDILAGTPDSPRWKDLKYLEEIFDTKVKEMGKLTRLQSLQNAITQSVESGKWQHIVVIGNPDVSIVLKKYLQLQDSVGAKTTIAIFSENKDLFDDFGVPLAQKYSDIDLQLTDENIYVFSDTKKEAAAIATLAERYTENVYDILAISCEQKQSVDLFRNELAKKSINAISLEAESLEHTEIFDLIKNLKAYCEYPSFKNFLNLARNPIVLKHFETISQKNAEDILADLDFIAQESICADIKQANSTLYARLNANDFESDKMRSTLLRVKYLRSIFAFADKCIEIANVPAALPLFISELISEDANENEQLVESVIDEAIENIAKAESLTKTKFTSNEIFSILTDYIKSTSVKIELEDKRLPLQDWMEIFWSDKPHLLLCDMNDGIVPLSNSDGMFLNDSIRKALGMRHQLLRQARDAYMLDTLCASRKKRGKVAVCVPKHNANEDPLMPSRILFQAPNLPHRTKLLFQEPPVQIVQKRYTPEWNLHLPQLKYTGRYSATRLNAYLNSPWQFYLQYVLKMNEVDPQKDEMDAMQFGDIFHKTLYKFALSNVKDSLDVKKISDCLLDEFSTIEHDTFGSNQRAQVRVQLETLKNRILACAKVQAEHRAKGWRIECAEKPFKTILNDREFVGVFDRIDVNEKTGARLILDYKTYDRAEQNITQDKHVKIRSDEIQWLNLQLPLYVCAANKMFNSDDIICGYFVAPKNISYACIDIWSSVNNFKESALLKMREIITNIESGIFAPTDDSPYNDYDNVFRLRNDLLIDVVKFDK